MDKNSNQKLNSGENVIAWLLALMYLLAIVGVEAILFLGVNPGWGVLVYGLMLISLLVFAALEPEERPMLLGLSGVPIIRIVAYGLPVSSSTLTIYFGVTALVLLSYIVFAIRMPEFTASHILKFPRNWLTQLSISLSGIVAGYCQFLVYPSNSLYFSGSLELIAFIATVALLVFVEEVTFRGIALTGFVEQFGQIIGVIFISFIYASLFISFGSIELGFLMFITSLFYGFMAIRLGLYGVIGAHFIASILYYLILPTI